MFSIQDQLSQATRAQMVSQLDTGGQLTDEAMESLQKVLELNLNLARATLEQGNFSARQLLAAADAEQFASLSRAQVQTNARRMLDYGYYLTTIASGTQVEFIKIIGAVIADTNRKLIELAEEFGRNAPLGVRTAIAFIKSVIDSASVSCDELTKTTQRTVKVVGSHLEARAGR